MLNCIFGVRAACSAQLSANSVDDGLARNLPRVSRAMRRNSGSNFAQLGRKSAQPSAMSPTSRILVTAPFAKRIRALAVSSTKKPPKQCELCGSCRPRQGMACASIRVHLAHSLLRADVQLAFESNVGFPANDSSRRGHEPSGLRIYAEIRKWSQPIPFKAPHFKQAFAGYLDLKPAPEANARPTLHPRIKSQCVPALAASLLGSCCSAGAATQVCPAQKE